MPYRPAIFVHRIQIAIGASVRCAPLERKDQTVTVVLPGLDVAATLGPILDVLLPFCSNGLIDELSLVYMGGSVIDFVDDLMGQSFQIRNPNAVASCGCGTSFSV